MISNNRGTSFIEIILGVAMIAASFLYFTKLATQQLRLNKDTAEEFVIKLAQENILSTVTSLSNERLFQIIKDENANGNTLSTYYRQAWMSEWEKVKGVTSLQYKVEVYPSGTVLHDPANTQAKVNSNNAKRRTLAQLPNLEYFEEYNKKITVVMNYKYKGKNKTRVLSKWRFANE